MIQVNQDASRKPGTAREVSLTRSCEVCGKTCTVSGSCISSPPSIPRNDASETFLDEPFLISAAWGLTSEAFGLPGLLADICIPADDGPGCGKVDEVHPQGLISSPCMLATGASSRGVDGSVFDKLMRIVGFALRESSERMCCEMTLMATAFFSPFTSISTLQHTEEIVWVRRFRADSLER